MTDQTTTVGGFPKMLRVGEAARVLHVHPNTLRKWNNWGMIPSYRIGSRGDRRFALDDLTSFLKTNGGRPLE